MMLFFACKRKDIPWYSKIIPALVVGYALSPIDLIPDFIPILGYLDDLIIIPLGILLAIKLIPKEVLTECKIEADQALEGSNPKNWIAGIIIILIWTLLAAYIVFKIFGNVKARV